MSFFFFFFFNDTATTEIYTLSLHDALPIYPRRGTHSLQAELPEPRRTPPAPRVSRGRARAPAARRHRPRGRARRHARRRHDDLSRQPRGRHGGGRGGPPPPTPAGGARRHPPP